ncbi:CRISPR-associated protein, Csy1 family [Desulfurispirillum indicum S5]|uniref:CRISPR-associated protein, Csy1 family n=1 Tax=Desulfurispirillum indicum (strain ATCC BAA-1389 / DSM 22839 / S5) TaxID=653733 RepID=E6W307_DESIS|nr:type I-F CRISPR-associated protein Csy1 [Desulfurispirillum indicum]ADU65668.1 CRISPR-associated protein, Csy1 family [Desulfurispirillum indicum S5]
MQEQETTLADKVLDYISNRLSDKLELNDKEVEKARAVADQDQLEQLQAMRNKLIKPENWLTDASKRAKQISRATHAAKYTHSDTRSSGVLFSEESAKLQKNNYLTSASVSGLEVDFVGNAAVFYVAILLKLEANGVMLLDEIAKGQSPTLEALSQTDEQYQEWLEGFKAALQDKQVQSGQLTKQVYFPLGNSNYHLISPLYASSLAHQLHQKITSAFFSDETKRARKAREKGLYDPQTLVFFPNLAVQAFGGTKPQNISQLNTQRYGKGYLLSCQPPSWTAQDFLPRKGQEAFWKELTHRTWSLTKRLQKHLAISFQRSSTLAIRQKREQLVDDLIDQLLQLAAEIQSKKKNAGWSLDSDLPFAEQLYNGPSKSDRGLSLAKSSEVA